MIARAPLVNDVEPAPAAQQPTDLPGSALIPPLVPIPVPTPISAAHEPPAAAPAPEWKSTGTPSSAPTDVIPLDELERRAILAALESTGGNRTKAAELLKISIRTLRNKLQEYRESGLLTGSNLDSAD